MSQAVVIIPARFGAQRLPGKPLLSQTGKPLICHVVDRARAARKISDVIVATDDERIAQAVRGQGAKAVMTRADHPNGTSRIAEVAAGLGPQVDVVVNVQGDEPEMEPDLIDRLVDRLRESGSPMATLACPFAPGEDPSNPNIVKMIVDQTGHAVYFSRALIPFDRDGAGAAGGGAGRTNYLKHPGLYAYRREFLALYITLPETPCERMEKLEQLRAIEHGHRIAVARVQPCHPGIDTPEQYDDFVARWRAGGKS